MLVWAGIELTGAGATFPYPLYSKMFYHFYKETGIKVNYQAIGSGGGIRQLMAKTVDFGATDAFVTDEELQKFKSPVVHIPTCIGAVVITYNLPGNPELKLTGQLIADIFLGKIKKWNDKKLVALNPFLTKFKKDIVVIHRSDGSGTTFVFSDYLCKVSPEWKNKVGRGKALRWPVGIGGKGNTGVAGFIKKIPFSIGYIELTYAIQNKMPYALVKNRAGRFVKPSLQTVSAAAKVKIPPDTRVSITNTVSPGGYPISGFTWIIVYKDLSKGNLNEKKAKALKELLWWMTHRGQQFAPSLHYAPLPPNVVKIVEKQIKSLTYKGKSL